MAIIVDPKRFTAARKQFRAGVRALIRACAEDGNVWYDGVLEVQEDLPEALRLAIRTVYGERVSAEKAMNGL